MREIIWQDEIESLAADKTSGSQAVCLKAAEVLVHALYPLSEKATVDEIHGFIRDFSTALKQAKPAMGGFYTLIGIADEALENTKMGFVPIKSIRESVERFRRRILGSNEQIAKNAVSLFPDGARIVTCSRSGTVSSVLRLAGQMGKLQGLLIAESQPACEGLITAEESFDSGMDVTLLTDAAIPGFIKDCDLVLVGGDALSPSGLVNKIGTYPLGLAAKREEKKFIACLGSEKIIPFDIPEDHLTEDPSDIYDDKPKATRIVNRVFEYTPFDLIDYIVTEERILDTGHFKELFQSQ